MKNGGKKRIHKLIPLIRSLQCLTQPTANLYNNIARETLLKHFIYKDQWDFLHLPNSTNLVLMLDDGILTLADNCISVMIVEKNTHIYKQTE